MPRIQGFNPHADTPVAGRRELLAEFLGLAVRLRAPIALALALLCWLPLHVIAVETAEVPASDGGYAAVNVDRAAQFAHVVASALQYLMPALLLTGTLVGSLQRRRRTAQGRERAGAVPVGAMLVEDFNRRLDAALSSRGYAVHLLENAVPGTADLMLARGAERRLVQRSHWQAWQVGESVIREFAAEISARQAHGGYFVTGGWFSREARAVAAECGIELVDGDALGEWLGAGGGAEPVVRVPAVRVRAVHVPAVRVPAVRVPVLRDEVPRDEVPRESVPALAPTPTPTPTPTPLMRGTSQGGDGLATPACPKCGTSMHKRQAIRGKMQGQYYWACARQPQCLGILPCRAEPDGAHYGAALMR